VQRCSCCLASCNAWGGLAGHAAEHHLLLLLLLFVTLLLALLLLLLPCLEAIREACNAVC
jgi:hypothetical protein